MNCPLSYTNCYFNLYLIDNKCTTAWVGDSRYNSKVVIISDGFKCPTSIDKNNWMLENNGFDYEDDDNTFSIIQNGAYLTVTRTDQNLGWKMNLKFSCCEWSKFITALPNFQLMLWRYFSNTNFELIVLHDLYDSRMSC